MSTMIENAMNSYRRYGYVVDMKYSFELLRKDVHRLGVTSIGMI